MHESAALLPRAAAAPRRVGSTLLLLGACAYVAWLRASHLSPRPIDAAALSRECLWEPEEAEYRGFTCPPQPEARPTAVTRVTLLLFASVGWTGGRTSHPSRWTRRLIREECTRASAWPTI